MVELFVNIDVDDVERGIEFYRSALGLALRRRLFAGTAAELVGAGCRVFLLENAAGSPPVPGSTAVREYRPHWTPIHLDLMVDDVAAAAARAVAAGAVQEGDVQRHPWGSMALLRDPFGHGFCFVQLTRGDYDDD